MSCTVRPVPRDLSTHFTCCSLLFCFVSCRNAFERWSRVNLVSRPLEHCSIGFPLRCVLKVFFFWECGRWLRSGLARKPAETWVNSTNNSANNNNNKSFHNNNSNNNVDKHLKTGALNLTSPLLLLPLLMLLLLLLLVCFCCQCYCYAARHFWLRLMVCGRWRSGRIRTWQRGTLSEGICSSLVYTMHTYVCT